MKTFTQFMAEQVEESMEIRTVKGKKYASAELVIRRARELAGPGKKPTREHRMQAHKELTTEQVEEGRESEFSANNAMASTSVSSGEKKGRLKNKKTGATVGIYPSLAHAQKVHDKHPDKKNLMVEEVEDHKTGDIVHHIPGVAMVKKSDMGYQVHRVTGPTTTHHIDTYPSKDHAIHVASSLGKNESVQELDELSKTTLGSYAKKAKDDHFKKWNEPLSAEHKTATGKVKKSWANSPERAKAGAKLDKRAAGIRRAEGKMMKESTVFSFVQEMISARPVVQESEVKQPLSFSEYRVLYEECLKSLDEEINEKKKMLMDKCKDIELDESPWDIPKKSSIDWGSDKKSNTTHSNGVTVHKAGDKPKHVEPEAETPKRGRGRPAGSYGKYKVSRTPEEKAAIGAKVHGNASRQASYSATIEARRKMNSVIKDKHASA